ncbi:VTT domain-containing protein [Paraburkholderia denitrificans]|uniref:VTT domain-containing protein n=1 Tax=Paraburkholderia denitrificans TaxID=694025 RepID=A0ABW0JGM3_9BURK
MEHAYAHLMHLLAGHPAWTLVVIFLAAFLEAVAVIGTFIPGSTVMFLGGALVGTGSLNLGWSLGCALVGAVAGDALSDWLGSRFKETISQMWPFRTHPKMLEKGHAFFIKHGAKSIVFARFIGPVRAVIPVVAGMFEMRPARFYAINVASALVWAPAHILPGIVFGASVQLAGAVSFRLVVLLAVLVGLVWMTLRVARFLARRASNLASALQVRLSDWATNHTGRTSSVILRLLSLDRTVLVITVSASAVVVLCTGVFFRILRDVIGAAPFLQLDVSVFQFMQSVRNPWSDSVLSRLSLLSSIPTLLALVATASCWMALERRWCALISWLGAVVFSGVVLLAIQCIIDRVPPGSLPTDAYRSACNHVAASVVVYGFIGFSIMRREGALIGFLAAMTCAVVISGTALSELYFGRLWLSDVVASAALALVWVAIVGLIAVWHRPHVSARGYLSAIFLLVAGCSSGLQHDTNSPRQFDERSQTSMQVLGTEDQWAKSLWSELPCYRADMVGERSEAFSIQWAAGREDIRRQLHATGWMESPGLDIHSVLSLAVPHAGAMELPVLPRLNNGVPSTMMFIRTGETPEDRYVLRFWDSGRAIVDVSGKAATRVWIGSLAHEHMSTPAWPFNVLRGDAPQGYPSTQLLAVPATSAISTVECRGTPLTLLTAMGR